MKNRASSGAVAYGELRTAPARLVRARRPQGPALAARSDAVPRLVSSRSCAADAGGHGHPYSRPSCGGSPTSRPGGAPLDEVLHLWRGSAITRVPELQRGGPGRDARYAASSRQRSRRSCRCPAWAARRRAILALSARRAALILDGNVKARVGHVTSASRATLGSRGWSSNSGRSPMPARRASAPPSTRRRSWPGRDRLHAAKPACLLCTVSVDCIAQRDGRQPSCRRRGRVRAGRSARSGS